MFIVLEGADGTGKSTLATILSKKLGGYAYATPPAKYRQYREQVDREATPEQHFAFYRDAVIDASQEIEQLEAENKTVVCDRYWISTVTYHQVMGLEIDLKEFSKIKKPDLTILLSASKETQISRMLVRGMSAGDRRMLDEQTKIAQGLFQNLVFTESKFIAINTGAFNVEQCANIAMSTINV